MGIKRFFTDLLDKFDGKTEIILLLVLLATTLALRVPNLGYSDYIGDEHKAFIVREPGEDLYTFFTSQRKGPMQFIVSHIPYLITGDFHNELAQRIPFMIFGAAAVFVFYAFLKRWFKNKYIAFAGAFLISVNGFIVGFSRIAQYQNLNLFFSFLALYFYVDFLNPSKNVLRNTIFGTVAFSLSVLSHWDAIFVIPPVAYFVIQFIRNSEIDFKNKKDVILSNFLVGVIVLMPFLIPYGYEQVSNEANKQYFTRRVETGYTNHDRHEFLIELYNPFVFLPMIIALGVVSILFFKTSWVPLLWFAINYGIFVYFVKKPDTHVYNFLIPAITAGSIGLVKITEKIKFLKYTVIALAVLAFSFLAYQSYEIYVDPRIEYPWEEEKLADFVCKKHEDRLGRPTKCANFADNFETKQADLKDNPPLFGFPLRRNWNEINRFVNEQNEKRGEDYKYISNEAKTVTEKYMDAGYGISGSSGTYAVGIKNPLSLVRDWNFPQYGGKETVYEIETQYGETVVRIYRIEPEDLEQ